MKKELPIKRQIENAIRDVKKAMIENMEADIAEVQSKDRKRKAHYALQQANARLQGLQTDMYSLNLESINNRSINKEEAKLI